MQTLGVTFPWSVMPRSRRRKAGRTLCWLGGPHIGAFNAPAERREGRYGLATKSRVC